MTSGVSAAVATVTSGMAARPSPAHEMRSADRPGLLLVGVCEARNVATDNTGAADFGAAEPDPYVVIEVRTASASSSMRARTSTDLSTVNPVWYELFEFDGVDGVDELPEVTLTLWDQEDWGRADRAFAQLVLPLRGGKPAERGFSTDGTVLDLGWLPLSGHQEVCSQGEVRVWLAWQDPAAPPSSLVPPRSDMVAAKRKTAPSARGTSLELRDYREPMDDEVEMGPNGRVSATAGVAIRQRAEVEEARRVGMRSLVAGEYELRVHVIEGRELIGHQRDGSADPYVKVSFLQQSRQTTIREEQTQPVWDEHLFIRVPAVEVEQLAHEQIEISVYDRNVRAPPHLHRLHTRPHIEADMPHVAWPCIV